MLVRVNLPEVKPESVEKASSQKLIFGEEDIHGLPELFRRERIGCHALASFETLLGCLGGASLRLRCSAWKAGCLPFSRYCRGPNPGLYHWLRRIDQRQTLGWGKGGVAGTLNVLQSI